VEFVRLPVTWNAGAKLHARLFYTLRALKQDTRLHAKVFDTIHRGGNNLLGRDEASTLELQTAWAKQNGIDPKAFSDAWNSMAVATRLRQADDLLRRYKPGGTPFMVINGRYTTDIQLAGGIPPMLEMINDLAAAEKRR
jgi:thiol:disulfide interchange protein DsbA